MKKMTKKELMKFKELILENKEAILDQIEHISKDTLKQTQKDASGDISGYTYHMADVATDTYDREFSLGIASNERQILYEIDDALKRIEDGNYGICTDCGKLVSRKRLKAIPYTQLCLKCQQAREKK